MYELGWINFLDQIEIFSGLVGDPSNPNRVHNRTLYFRVELYINN